MRKIIIFTNLTLDGVMQAPGQPDEDTRGSFQYGGWAAPYQAMRYASGVDFSDGPLLLFGRRTYENFYAYWPHQTDNPYTEVLNNTPKYVASTTLKEPLPWQNSTLLQGSVSEKLAALKQQPGRNFLVMGSGGLVQTLMQHHLVDLFVLMIHPLILGSGRRLFPEGTPYTSLKLLETKSTPTDVIVATYQPG